MATGLVRKPVPSEAATRIARPSTQSTAAGDLADRQSSSSIEFEEHDLDLIFQPVSPATVENEPLLLSSGRTSSSVAPQPSDPLDVNNRQGSLSINNTPPSPGDPTAVARHVSWGVNWRKPFFICAYLLCARSFSLGHHFYYSSLHDKIAGDEE
jgi:hypothetical protein